MANYYSYFDNSTAGQNTRSEIDEESAIFGMGVSQDINCGIITARSGIAVTGGQLTVGAAFSVGAAGVVTAASYYGDGSALTGLATTDYVVSIATTTGLLNVGTGATIESSGNATLGILTASNATLGILTASSVICNATTIPFYPPVVTTTQRDAMTVTAGAMVYNSSTNKLNFYNGSTWKVVSVD